MLLIHFIYRILVIKIKIKNVFKGDLILEKITPIHSQSATLKSKFWVAIELEYFCLTRQTILSAQPLRQIKAKPRYWFLVTWVFFPAKMFLATEPDDLKLICEKQ